MRRYALRDDQLARIEGLTAKGSGGALSGS
jgi:hypothetical protein